ncbi:hypothetical protein EB796_014008 [Bugula neritina]|uniref:Uncharacterized protein n=1 Tax=Bugula neritina TaxID=10212 RepID=A0A7J7JP58_BUGNE|nr:hypothetical protein EB796_014008 [Bugula neritina]
MVHRYIQYKIFLQSSKAYNRNCPVAYKCIFTNYTTSTIIISSVAIESRKEVDFSHVSESIPGYNQLSTA